MDDDNNLKKCSTGHELYAVTSPPRHSVMMTSPSQYEVPMTSTPYYDVTMTSIPSYDVQMALTPRYHGPITSGPRCDVPMNSTPRSDVTGVKCHSLGSKCNSVLKEGYLSRTHLICQMAFLTERVDRSAVSL